MSRGLRDAKIFVGLPEGHRSAIVARLDRTNVLYPPNDDKDEAKPVETVKVDLRLQGREMATPARREAPLRKLEARLGPRVAEKERVRIL